MKISPAALTGSTQPGISSTEAQLLTNTQGTSQTFGYEKSSLCADARMRFGKHRCANFLGFVGAHGSQV